MFTDIRLQCQQLATQQYDRPEELVSWMGAVQAQDPAMAKWAVGVRLRNATLAGIIRALNEGKIVRTHVMRPTWHFVAAEDIRWMLQLTGKRIQAANESLARAHKLEIEEKTYFRCDRVLEKILEGRSLTRPEIETGLNRAGIASDAIRTRRILMHAETAGLVCNGLEKGKEPTYALLEERIAPVPALTKEEALARLAEKYFQSHSPATLQDFVWWSGLTTGEARQALSFIQPRLVRESREGSEYFILEPHGKTAKIGAFHLLPSFDEYLISYKDRTAVLERTFHPRAFNAFGIFHPVVLHDGIITGNWKKGTGKKRADIAVSFFRPEQTAGEELIRAARERYLAFTGEYSPSR